MQLESRVACLGVAVPSAGNWALNPSHVLEQLFDTAATHTVPECAVQIALPQQWTTDLPACRTQLFIIDSVKTEAMTWLRAPTLLVQLL